MNILVQKKHGLSRFVFCVLAVTAFAASAMAAEVQVFAQVDTSNAIYAGERFNYNIVVDGTDAAAQVDLGPLAKYAPAYSGKTDRSQTSISIINGRKSITRLNRYVMTYQLTAIKAGTIHLPAVEVTIGGASYMTSPVRVEISQADTTTKLDIEVLISKKRCYIGEPILMTINWYLAVKLANISGAVQNVRFSVPVLNSDAFHVEDLDDAKPSETRVVHNGVDSAMVSYKKILIPKQSGQIAIAPATVSADIAVGRSRRRSFFFDSGWDYRRFMAGSEAMTLEVENLPTAGKPGDFNGLVGRYTISTDAKPTKVNVGDPITLTVKVGGSKYLKPVRWPDLVGVKKFAENFKIPTQRSLPIVEGGFKVFTQTIRANNDKVEEIPPVPLSYFDTDKGQYVTVKSKPIKLEVAPTKILTSADVIGREFERVNREVEAIKKGISANYEGLDALENQEFSIVAALIGPGYLSLWGLPFIAMAASALLKVITYTSPEKTKARRRRQARRNAVRQLKEIAETSAQQSSGQKSRLLISVMREYIGERFDRTSVSLTGADCEREIFERTGDSDVAGAYRGIMESSQEVFYAGTGADFDAAQVQRAIELIGTIDIKAGK